MEDLYPIAEEGPKCRGRQSIKLRRREPQGDGLNAQLGRTFHKKKKNLDDPPGWTHPGDSCKIENQKRPILQLFSAKKADFTTKVGANCKIGLFLKPKIGRFYNYFS